VKCSTFFSFEEIVKALKKAKMTDSEISQVFGLIVNVKDEYRVDSCEPQINGKYRGV
jgi:hypothetical protein